MTPVFEDKSLLVEGWRWWIWSLMVSILSFKKLIKSLLQMSTGKHGSIEPWLDCDYCAEKKPVVVCFFSCIGPPGLSEPLPEKWNIFTKMIRDIVFPVWQLTKQITKEVYKEAMREYRNIFYSNLKHLKEKAMKIISMFEWGSGNSGWNETYKRNMANIL